MKQRRTLLMILAALIAAVSALGRPENSQFSGESINEERTSALPVTSENPCLGDSQRALEERNKEILMEAYQVVWGDHNTDEVGKYYDENVIEHSPASEDGIEAQKRFAIQFSKGRSKETIHFRKVSAEGNLVWSHWKADDQNGTDFAVMDIVRMENGKIAEHWDVVQIIPVLMKGNNNRSAAQALRISNGSFPEEGLPEKSEDKPATTISSLSELSCQEQRAQEEKHKEIVKAAFQEVFGDHNVEAADKYFHQDVIENSQGETSGIESFKKLASLWNEDRPKEKIDFRKVSAQGDLVWTHIKMQGKDGSDLAFIDIFRIENGKIAEHWGAIQPVPELSQSKNSHPMF